jgi:hypothetical protein
LLLHHGLQSLLLHHGLQSLLLHHGLQSRAHNLVLWPPCSRSCSGARGAMAGRGGCPPFCGWGPGRVCFARLWVLAAGTSLPPPTQLHFQMLLLRAQVLSNRHLRHARAAPPLPQGAAPKPTARTAGRRPFFFADSHPGRALLRRAAKGIEKTGCRPLCTSVRRYDRRGNDTAPALGVYAIR